LPAEAVPLRLRDLRGLDEPARQAAIRADITDETHTAFDLARQAPTRWTLYQIGERRFIVLLAAHHIVMDEWSLTLLRRQIEGQGTARRPPALQYADYAAWQRRARSPAAIDKELAWWEKQLAGLPQLCTFPADRTNPTGLGVTGETRQFHLGAELVSELRALIRREGVTVYMALLAAFAAVLRVHSGQDDIVLGSSTGMRERPEFEEMVGPFVNLLVLRLRLEDDPSFVELLGRARDVLLDALEHRQVPFEMLVDRLRPPRSFDRPPLFQVSVVLHNAADEAAPSSSAAAPRLISPGSPRRSRAGFKAPSSIAPISTMPGRSIASPVTWRPSWRLRCATPSAG
jgi:hypothetical protein